MQNETLFYQSGSAKYWLVLLCAAKNILYIAAAALSFSLWFASTVNTPNRLETLEERITLINAAQSRIEGRLEFALEDLRFLKNSMNKK
ncbi:MAG: hypothetical protein ACI352_04410 [Elusimicrobiaceae bacterium]|nr:hypothetical protein [Elusimicrobiota bacterium]